MPTKTTTQQLTNDQLTLLALILKFRFITRQSLSMLYAKTKPSMDTYRRLKLLENVEMISKRFDKSYRLLAKPAAYYMLPKGVNELSKNSDASERKRRVKSIYKNRLVSEQFIDQCLDIFRLYITLNTYNDGLKFFTKADLGHEDFTYFPMPLPDAYIKLANGSHFFVELNYAYQPFFVVTRAVKRYIDYHETGIWKGTRTEFPILLFIVDTANTQKQLHKHINTNFLDIKIYTALKLDIINDNENIWHSTDEPEVDYEIKDLK